MTRFAQPLELISPYSPQECRERIAAITNTGFMAAFVGSRPLVGRLEPEVLRLRKRRNFHSPVWPSSNASIRQHRNGSLISVAFFIPLNEILIGIGALLFLVIFSIGGFIYQPFLYDPLTAEQSPNVLNISFILIYIVLWLVSLLFSRSEPRFIKALLVSTLNAQIITPVPVSPEDTP